MVISGLPSKQADTVGIQGSKRTHEVVLLAGRSGNGRSASWGNAAVAVAVGVPVAVLEAEPKASPSGAWKLEQNLWSLLSWRSAKSYWRYLATILELAAAQAEF